MKIGGKDINLVNAALERLKAVHPVQVKNLVIRGERQGSCRMGWRGDAETAQGTVSYVFEASFTSGGLEAVRHLLIQAKTAGQPNKSKGILLLADYVNPSLGQQLREADINFIDTAGNVFLQQEPGLHLYVEGKKLQTPAKEAPTRLFQPSGLTLLFGLLVTPESVNRSYRDLAKANGVALGTVGWIMRDLREQGYVEPLGKDRIQLIRKKELLDRWVDGYATRLRPKILAGEFVLDPTKDFDSVMDGFENYAFEQNMQWGLTGGFGAFELLHHYRGMTLSIFIEKWSSYTALAALHLLPHEGGWESASKFLASSIWENRQTEPDTRWFAIPLLVYAELEQLQGGDRELEAGRHLYTTFLEESLAKD
ncbi:MAG: hypothetical protein R3B74_06500 [Nitrospirales bacterium]|nr:hypothetical protein [Nitrospirales bacterium]